MRSAVPAGGVTMEDFIVESVFLDLGTAQGSHKSILTVLEGSSGLADLDRRCPAPNRELHVDVYHSIGNTDLGQRIARVAGSYLARTGAPSSGATIIRHHTSRKGPAIHICARKLGTHSAQAVIRDPVHGDIVFNPREYAIVRSRLMQRLHQVRQLGAAYHVYPGAMHTRFDHSLGTFHMAKKFIAELEAAGHVLTLRAKEAIRAASLLHDVGHRPFEHTLIDEGRIGLGDHDGRSLKMIDEDGELRSILGDLLRPVEAVLLAKDVHFPRLTSSDIGGEDQGLWQEATELWPDVQPFMGQIVGDTVCADLCDYLHRDMLYTGLRRGYDERILKFLTVHTDKSLGLRFLAFRIADSGVTSPDAVSEIVHLLTARHALGARVYFHHHKMAFGAMICKAVRMLRRAGQFQEDVLDKVGDEGFLLYLAGNLAAARPHSCQGVAELARAVMERRHYYRAYVLAPEKVDMDLEEVKSLVRTYRNQEPEAVEKNLLDVEKEIAAELDIEEHQVAVCCTDPQMKLKEAEVYVIDTDGRFRVLAEAKHLAPGLESVMRNHESLWRFYVFVKATDEYDPILSRAKDTCERMFELQTTLKPPHRDQPHEVPASEGMTPHEASC